MIYKYILLQIISLLLDHGASASPKNKNGDTFLHLIAMHNCFNVIKPILEILKPTINMKNNHGKTPLHIAAKLGHIKTLQILLGCGAYVNSW